MQRCDDVIGCSVVQCHGRAQRRLQAEVVGAAVITPVMLLCGAHLLRTPRAPRPLWGGGGGGRTKTPAYDVCSSGCECRRCRVADQPGHCHAQHTPCWRLQQAGWCRGEDAGTPSRAAGGSRAAACRRAGWSLPCARWPRPLRRPPAAGPGTCRVGRGSGGQFERLAGLGWGAAGGRVQGAGWEVGRRTGGQSERLGGGKMGSPSGCTARRLGVLVWERGRRCEAALQTTGPWQDGTAGRSLSKQAK